MIIILRADHYRFLTWLVMKLVTIMSTLLFKLIWTLSHLMKLVKLLITILNNILNHEKKQLDHMRIAAIF